MSEADIAGRLIRLSDTDLTVADPSADVPGRQAVDRDGEEIGTVEDLLIGDEEHKVRLLRTRRRRVPGHGQGALPRPDRRG